MLLKIECAPCLSVPVQYESKFCMAPKIYTGADANKTILWYIDDDLTRCNFNALPACSFFEQVYIVYI